MSGSLGETYFQEVVAIRKGRGQRSARSQTLCEIKVGITDEGEVVLRTLDESGVPPIVALLDKSSTQLLIQGLQQALESAVGATTSVANR